MIVILIDELFRKGTTYKMCIRVLKRLTKRLQCFKALIELIKIDIYK